MNNLSVLIKPSSNKCNINCQYCFYKDVSDKRLESKGNRMSLATLESIVKRAFDFADQQVTFAFQGGEPTLMGLEFYKAFISYVKTYNLKHCKVNYTLQTNGILLDDDWFRFLKNHHFLVGLSFDGLERIHNLHRIDYKGEGTHERVLSTLKGLKDYEVDFNILMVVTHEHVDKVKETYTYLKQLGVGYLQFIPVLDPLYQGHDNYDYSLSNHDLEVFLKDLFDLWFEDYQQKNELRITYFENIVYKLMGNSHVACSINGECALQMVVEGDGSVYPCDFFVLDHYKLGNVNEDSFETMINHRRALIFVNENHENTERQCSSCQWYGLCYGSCKRYQVGKFGRFEPYFCQSYKGFLEYAIPRLKRIAHHIVNF